MIIIGIDPGTATTGYGIVKFKVKDKKKNGIEYVVHGCIRTNQELSMPARLLKLKKELRVILRKYQPNSLAIEMLFFGQNSKTAMTVGQARGVVMVTAEELKVPLFEYQGLSVKKLLTDNGRAKKREIQMKVKKILRMKEKPRPDDAADALAVAICHCLKLTDKFENC